MTVFKAFFAVSKKYINNLIMYTCIFLGIITATTKANSDKSIESFKSTRLQVAYFNHSNSKLSDKLIEYLSTEHNLTNELKENIDVFRDEIYNRNYDYILIIPEDFETSHNVTAYKLPGSITSEFMDMSINNFVKIYDAYTLLGMDSNEAYDSTLSTLSKSTEVSVIDEAAKAKYSDDHYFYLYMPYILISVICLSLSPVLIAFNEEEIKKRTICSGISMGSRNLSLAAGCFIYTIGIVIFYIVVSIIMYKKLIFTTAGAIRILNTLTFSLVALSFAFLISNLTKKPNVVNMVVNAVGLGSSFICGVFVPREYMSNGVISAGRFFPAYWYVNVEEAASSLENAFNSKLITGIGIQLLFAAAFMIIALALSGKKLKTN